MFFNFREKRLTRLLWSGIDDLVYSALELASVPQAALGAALAHS